MDSNRTKKQALFVLSVVILGLSRLGLAQASLRSPAGEDSAPGGNGTLAASDLGIAFVGGSSSEIIVEHGGKHYLVDTANHTVREVDSGATARDLDSKGGATAQAQQTQESASSVDQQVTGNSGPQSQATGSSESKVASRIYKPGDDFVYTLPTGRRIDRHGLYLDFTHRFPYEAAFTETGRGDTLLGLDDFSISSFGVRYGVTSRLSVNAYRSPSVIGRPIELGVAYNFLDEKDGNPLNAAARVSISGQNNFAVNFTENLELMVSRSLGPRAQLYAVPTFSIRDRPLLPNTQPELQDHVPVQHCYYALAVGTTPGFNVRPCANVFALGVGASVDVRPTVALVAEANPTLANGPELGIHRSAFAFGIKKKIWRHAFTFGFTNSPGTTTSGRSGTNATLQMSPGADKPSAMFVGFDLTRQIY
ncbi:MAG TPA: DUF5777 family beta-barrel protein [Terriglobales bacterium]|nr:DUF5777 family beta-barrel protein [Terriglobales bacterium]